MVKQKKLRLLPVFMALVMVLSVIGVRETSARAKEQVTKGIYVETPSQKEISERLAGLKDIKTAYATEPTFKAPYAAGTLSDETLQNALDWMNAVRFIAGIPDNVTLNNEYNKYAQASSIVNLANDTLSHYPEKPDGIDETLYQQGYIGSQNCNIAWGGGSRYKNGTSFYNMIVHCWMDDSDASNIDRVGHRRWILNPSMKEAGFGAVWDDGGKYGGRYYSAMFAMDNYSGKTDYYGVAWPAQNMPVSFFEADYAWSISMGFEVSSDAEVELTRESDGKKWTFKSGSKDFYIENSGYGRKGCIIFRPDGISSYNHGDTFKVVITGTGLDVQYYVNFFDPDKASDTTPTLEPTKEITPDPTQKVTPDPTKEITPDPTAAVTKKSLASVKFTFTDIRTGKEVTFKGNDGVPKVLLLGGLGTCYNTISAMESFTSLIPKIDGDFELYALDIKDNTDEFIINWMNEDNIISSANAASVDNISGSSYSKLYKYGQDAIDKNGGDWLMPMVLYIEGNGDLASSTVCYQSKSVIEEELSKIVKFGKEPTPDPTKEITPKPTEEPTPEPTQKPTAKLTEEPTPEPTEKVTPEPTKEVTPVPTQGASADGTFANTKFEMTDVLSGSKVKFDGGDGKAKIILFGDLSSCWNTLDIVDSFGYAMGYATYDIDIYLIDTKNSKDRNLKNWLNYANINDSMFASGEKKVSAKGDMSVEEIKKTILSAAGVNVKGRRYNFVSPAVAYIDGNGDIVNATTGYVDYDNIVPLMDYLMDENADISVSNRSGRPESIIENTVKSDTSVVQKVLKTDVMGGQTLDVYKVSKKGKKENTSYTVTGKNTLTLMSTITDLTKLTIPSYVKIDGKKYYVTVIDQPGNPQISKVTQITIGKKVKKITKDAFKSVEKLSVVNITAGKLKKIAKGAFSMTDETTVFNIKGTKDQFEKVKKLLIASGVSEKATFNNT